MTNKNRAALWFLSDTDDETVEYKLQDLEEANENSSAAMIVNVWHPFQEVTVGKLLEEMGKLEQQFNDCQGTSHLSMRKDVNMIRNFRDSDQHVCNADQELGDECTCEPLDRIIDVLSD